jgi:hypothetical protein
MLKKVLVLLLFFLFLSSVLSSDKPSPARWLFLAERSTLSLQDVPSKKPKDDYMSKFLRNTSPLGLKEDLLLKRLLKQSNIKWAVRSGKRHILD